MFGSKESKIARLIKKGKWEVLSKKYLNSDTETKILLRANVQKLMSLALTTYFPL